MSDFAVHVMQQNAGEFMEVTREAETWQDVLEILQFLPRDIPNWRAVTVLHIEDFPKVMEGATPMGPV